MPTHNAPTGAAMPDIALLLKEKHIKVNPETGLPDTALNPETTRVIKRAGGEEETIKETSGYVRDLNFPKWRMNLSPEQYYRDLEKEYEVYQSGVNQKYAADLYPSELEDFKIWLNTMKQIDLDIEQINVREVIGFLARRRAEQRMTVKIVKEIEPEIKEVEKESEKVAEVKKEPVFTLKK